MFHVQCLYDHILFLMTILPISLNVSFENLHTGCYAMKFGSRGYGHSGISSLGLMSDALDIEWQW